VREGEEGRNRKGSFRNHSQEARGTPSGDWERTVKETGGGEEQGADEGHTDEPGRDGARQVGRDPCNIREAEEDEGEIQSHLSQRIQQQPRNEEAVQAPGSYQREQAQQPVQGPSQL
jgi:hypothetical protein